MATNLNRTGNAIPRQYNRQMPGNPPNHRPGMTGNRDVTAPPNVRSSFRERNDPARPRTHVRGQVPFIGNNPANLHLASDEHLEDDLSTTTSRSIDFKKGGDDLDDLVYGGRSPSLTGDGRGLDNLHIDPNDSLNPLLLDNDDREREESLPSVDKESNTGSKNDAGSDDEPLLETSAEAPKQPVSDKLQGMLANPHESRIYRPKKKPAGNDFDSGLGDPGPSMHEDPNAIDPGLVGRAEIGIPDANASTGLRAAGGAAAGAAIGTAAGTAVGAVVAGVALTTLAAGAIVATGGLIIPIGAAVGLLVGAAVGAAHGGASARRAKADYLDTRQQGTVQRASKYGWLRMLMPKQLGRRVWRSIKPASRSVVGRLWNFTTKKCKGGKKLKMEDRGRNARPSEARRDLRYAVASDVAYSMSAPGPEDGRFDNNASAEKFKASQQTGKANSKFLAPGDALTDNQITELLAKHAPNYPPDPNNATTPKKRKELTKELKAYNKDQRAYDRERYAELHKSAIRNQATAAVTNAAFEKNEGVKPWEFKTIGPNAKPGSEEHEIFKRLPESLQQSLTDGQGVFRDPDTGNNVRIMYDKANDEVVIAYNGTGGGDPAFWGHGGTPSERAQNRTNLSNLAGGTPPSVKQAVAIGKAVREAVQKHNDHNQANINVVSTGHSRGGLLATVDAIKNRGKAVTFNPEALGAGVRDYCGIYTNNRVPEDVDITVYSTRNEHVSGSGLASGIGTAAELTLGNLPLPILKVPPVIIGERRILPQAAGFRAHPDQVIHMANLAGGAQPPPKARMRWGSDARRDSLYVREPDRAPPRSDEEVFKDRVTAFATPQGQMRLIGNPIMKNAKVRDLDLDEFERDLANAADFLLKNRPGDIDPDDMGLIDQAVAVAIALNLQRKGGVGVGNAARGSPVPTGNRVDMQEEKPIHECVDEYRQLVISAADDDELLNKVMETPTMKSKNYDLASMNRSKFRENLAKSVPLFAPGVTSEDKVRSQAITAISTAIHRTMKES